MAQKRQKKDRLNPKKMTKVRREFFDYTQEDIDRIKEGGPEVMEFFAKFNEEWLGGAVSKITTKDGKKRPVKGHLHSTNKLAKDVYDRNNRRNNDVYGVSNANTLLTHGLHYSNDEDVDPTSLTERSFVTNPDLIEQATIARIDNEEPELLTKEEFEKLKDQLTPEMLIFYLSIYDKD